MWQILRSFRHLREASEVVRHLGPRSVDGTALYLAKFGRLQPLIFGRIAISILQEFLNWNGNPDNLRSEADGRVRPIAQPERFCSASRRLS